VRKILPHLGNGATEAFIMARRERLHFRIYQVEGQAEGRFAIGAVVVAALVGFIAWLWATGRTVF